MNAERRQVAVIPPSSCISPCGSYVHGGGRDSTASQIHLHGCTLRDRLTDVGTAGVRESNSPVALFRRGTKEVLGIAPTVGTALTVFYRPYPWGLRVSDRLRRTQRVNHIREWGNPPDVDSTKQWSTPLY